MTEDEAKTKWCPFGRAAYTQGGSYNRDNDGHPLNTDCIASACMAWRAVKFDATADKIAAIREHRRVFNSDLLTAKNAIDAQWAGLSPTEGYCGLAGAPA